LSRPPKPDSPQAREAEARLRASEQLNRSIIDAMPCGMVHVQADGSIIAANAEALEILGLRFEELSAKYVVDFDTQTLREDGSPCPVEEYPVSRALTTGDAQEPVTIGVRRPDGFISWAIFTAVPLRDPDSSTVTGAIVTFLDITERKRAEEALAASEAELRALLESAPNIIFAANLDLRIVWINTTVAGLTKEQVLGQSIYEFIAKEQHEMVRAQIARVLEQGVAISYQGGPTEYSSQHWTVSAGPIKREGVIQGVIFILADVTELEHAKKEQAELEARLRHAQRMEAIGRLAGGVAHDFNNMLSVVLGHADLLLQRGGPPSDWERAMLDIRDAAQRASILTRQLLALGRKQVLTAQVLDLHQVLLDLRNILERLLGADIALRLRTDPALGAVSADPAQIEQVIVNLAANARDAMPQGGTFTIETVNVSLAIGDKHRPGQPAVRDYVCLRTSDTGVGMDGATRERMFEPFFTTKEPGAGTGLGMATVHGIVEQSGGHIEVQSAPHMGTTISVYLPRVEARQGTALGPPEAPATERQSRKARVLLVEDEALVRDVVGRVLASAGHIVFSADSAEQALLAIEHSAAAPELVLTDVVMPGMSGPQLAERLRARDPQLKVVFMSGYAETKLDPSAFARPGTLFLQKPFKSEVLLEAIQSALSGRTPRRDPG
jgi:two-component system cell cycle sensor histidine kinase/response regulator CckA